MNLTEAVKQAEDLRDRKMLDNEMLITSVEVFFYTKNIKLGLIFTFDFYTTNTGLV